MEKTMLEKEITMTKFLSHFLGVNPAIARNITHKDASVLFSNLVVYTDADFYSSIEACEMINYVRVKDCNKKTMYYEKPLIKDNTDIPECTDFEYNFNMELDSLVAEFIELNISDLEKWQLLELIERLKCIKKHNRKILNEEIKIAKKQLRKIKKEGNL